MSMAAWFRKNMSSITDDSEYPQKFSYFVPGHEENLEEGQEFALT